MQETDDPSSAIPSSPELAALIASAEKDENGLPPVHLWNPELSGTMDMHIRSDGRWFYLGSEIKRPRLVKLFSTILRRETGDGADTYYLVTPVEKWIIQVDDAPFIATSVERITANSDNSSPQDSLVFTTNVGATVIAGKSHPIRVEIDPQTQEPRPYILVRSNLEALIGRNAFYQLVEWSHRAEGSNQVFVSSDGVAFSLGMLDAD